MMYKVVKGRGFNKRNFPGICREYYQFTLDCILKNKPYEDEVKAFLKKLLEHKIRLKDLACTSSLKLNYIQKPGHALLAEYIKERDKISIEAGTRISYIVLKPGESSRPSVIKKRNLGKEVLKKERYETVNFAIHKRLRYIIKVFYLFKLSFL